MAATADATTHNTCVRWRRETSSAEHVSRWVSMCDCPAPLRCRVCVARAKETVVGRLNDTKELTLESVHELVARAVTVHVRFMVKKILEECPTVIRVGEMVQASIYYAEKTLAAEPNPVDLTGWAAEHGVPESEMQRLIERAAKRPTKVHVWREGTRWYGRGQTPLNLTNETSLLSHLKRQGVRGTPLTVIYSEYQLAYKHVHENPLIYICEGHAWHETVAGHEGV